MVTAVVLVGVVALVLGASLGWLERGRRCRASHAHLVGDYDQGDLDTFLGPQPGTEPGSEPSPEPGSEPGSQPGPRVEPPSAQASLTEPPAADPAPAPVPDLPPDPVVVPGAFPGSALPGPGGTSPAPGYVVKAKASSRIYHTESSPSYQRTRAEVWFQCPEQAEAAGFRAPRNSSRG